MTTDTDARRLRQKNAKALRLVIEQSKRDTMEKAREAARLAKLKRQQDQAFRRLKGLIILSSSDGEHERVEETGNETYKRTPEP
ncbi:Bifunctional dihydroflavonol 4-reductase/flavanone 4-reductase [Hordeum vulgare]|nr:Bifunctional dihydroflavonol 4-reductase/flavanone 4-reductase [Hordeum vulgare]